VVPQAEGLNYNSPGQRPGYKQTPFIAPRFTFEGVNPIFRRKKNSLILKSFCFSAKHKEVPCPKGNRGAQNISSSLPRALPRDELLKAFSLKTSY